MTRMTEIKKEIIQLSGQIIGAAIEVLNELKLEYLQWKRAVRQIKTGPDVLDVVLRNSYPRHPRNPRF
jgi:hypothetical protein